MSPTTKSPMAATELEEYVDQVASILVKLIEYSEDLKVECWSLSNAEPAGRIEESVQLDYQLRPAPVAVATSLFEKLLRFSQEDPHCFRLAFESPPSEDVEIPGAAWHYYALNDKAPIRAAMHFDVATNNRLLLVLLISYGRWRCHVWARGLA